MKRDSAAYFYFLFASRLVYKPRLALKLAHIKITAFPLSVCSIYLISSRLYDDGLLFISSSFPASHLISLKGCIFPFFASRALFMKVVIKEKIKVHYNPRIVLQVMRSVYNAGRDYRRCFSTSVERIYGVRTDRYACCFRVCVFYGSRCAAGARQAVPVCNVRARANHRNAVSFCGDSASFLFQELRRAPWLRRHKT